ncbi:MAG: glycosyltransferase [bacterium]|nr:glycosyltransferase [bacterium]
MSGKFYRSADWQLKTGDNEDSYFLENSRGGKIILDQPVKNVLETVDTKDGKTFEELDRRKLIASGELRTLLTVFSRAGVLETEGETQTPRPQTPLESEPSISIIIINYNGDYHLPDLFDSIHRQTYEHWEVIVVDNCSTDNSRFWVAENHPGVRLKALEKNTGFAAAVNTGIREASGDFFLVLNNDMELEGDALYQLAKTAFSAGPDVKWAAIAPKMKFFNNRAFINAVGNSIYPITWGSDNYIGYVDLGQFDHVGQSLSACFGAVLLNPAALEDVGLLCPGYKFYYEDMDWSFRARALGYSIITAPKAVFYHKFGASMSLKSQTFKTRYIVSNRLHFTLKNLGRGTRKRFLFNYLFEDIKSTLIYLKRGNFPMIFAYFRGYLRLLVSFPRLFYRRRQLWKRRKTTGVEDVAIFSNAAPLNMTLMEQGIPKLDIYSLRANYPGAGAAAATDTPGDAGDGDIFIWRLRPPRKDIKSVQKIYMEFSFFLPEAGHYDIHLLGLIRGNPVVYLDNKPVTPSTGKNKTKNLEMNLSAGENIYITADRHMLELGWRSRVHAVILRKTKGEG